MSLKSPLPWREGMKGRGIIFLFTPTLTLPHQRGRGSDGNFKYLWIAIGR